MNELIFDIETQNTFADVNNDFKKFRISVVSLYDYADDKYYSFTENEFKEMWPFFEKADRIIGYNSEHFDVPILNNYYPGDMTTFGHLDMMKEIYKSIGRRIKLDDIAQSTLDNIKKSAVGLQAVQWWKEGKIDEIKKYCEQDVKVTKEIYEFGKKHKQLFYKSFKGEDIPFAVNFSESKTENISSRGINLTLPI